MENSISPELIRKYLTGECSPEEAAKIRDWYDSFEDDEDPLVSLSPGERTALREMMFSQVMNQLESMDQLPRRRIFLLKTAYVILGGAAAAFLLLFGLDLLFERSSPPEPTPAQTALKMPVEKTKEVVVENSSRAIRRQMLPDGSVVWLKPDTRITYPVEFDLCSRKVSMLGEAFFEVTRDVSRPFTVYSGEIVTRVLGTSFNIKAYDDGSAAEVSVFTGQVAVSLPQRGGKDENTEILLVKDEKAVFLHKEKLLEKRQYTMQKQPELNIWQKNSISFDNVPVKEVVKELSKAFDVDLRVHKTDKELNNYILKADFTNQNLPDILQMLEKSLNLTYEIEGREIVLKLAK